jgi:chromosome segregation ATPase
MATTDYLRAYETAKQQLAEVLRELQELEQKKMLLRQTLEALEAQCRAAGIDVDPSEEATYLRDHTGMSDEIRSILKAQPLAWLRPAEIREELANVGHDLAKYKNPQATIHMVLKRLVQSGEAEEQTIDGKQAYRARGFLATYAANLLGATIIVPRNRSRDRELLSRLAKKK